MKSPSRRCVLCAGQNGTKGSICANCSVSAVRVRAMTMDERELSRDRAERRMLIIDAVNDKPPRMTWREWARRKREGA